MEEEKKTNKRIVFSVIAVLLLVAVVAGATYAYFSATSSTNTQTVTTGTLTMGFTNGDIIRATDITPINDDEIKTKATELPFSVTNTGNQHMKLTIKLTDITISDALKDIDFRWGLYNADTDVGLSFGFFKNIGSATEEIIYRDTIIDASDPDITKNYKLRIWIHDDGALQNELQGQTFSARVRVDGEVVEYTPESCFTMCTQELINQGECENWDIGNMIDYDADTCGTDVVIPKTIGGKNVTGFVNRQIDDWWFGPFTGKNLTSVIIPDSVNMINPNAFRANNLAHVTIPESVIEIGASTFGDNNLTSVYIPESVYCIGPETFSYNKLTEVALMNKNTSLDNYEPSSCTGLDSNLFSYNQLTDVVLMEGVDTIGSLVFSDNPLTSIEIPSSVMWVYDDAFYSRSNLTEIVVRGKSSLSDFRDSKGLTTSGGLPEGVNIVFRP